jgi:hypothetical protein
MKPIYLALLSAFVLQNVHAQKKSKVTKPTKATTVVVADDPSKPHFNNASVYATKIKAPFLLKLAVTRADAPLRFMAKGLPLGLYLDTAQGIISGEVLKTGKFKVQVTAKAKNGLATKEINIQCGDTMRTPPALIVHLADENLTDSLLRVQVKKWADKKLFNYGWQYLTIGNVWQDSARNANGNLFSNAKFPDMQDMVLWLHEQGIKFGLTATSDSSKNATIMSSYGYEKQDAATFSRWGVDLVQYEYKRMNDSITKLDSNRTAGQKMHSILNNQSRFMPMLSFASAVTTNDSIPTTPQTTIHLDSLRSVLTKQCLSSEPLIINYLSANENTSSSILFNEELIAIHQDALMQPAVRFSKTDSVEVWSRKLSDGTSVFAFFNLTDNEIAYTIKTNDIGTKGTNQPLKDIWAGTNLIPVNSNWQLDLKPKAVFLIKLK